MLWSKLYRACVSSLGCSTSARATNGCYINIDNADNCDDVILLAVILLYVWGNSRNTEKLILFPFCSWKQVINLIEAKFNCFGALSNLFEAHVNHLWRWLYTHTVLKGGILFWWKKFCCRWKHYCDVFVISVPYIRNTFVLNWSALHSPWSKILET
jgi:hypothetical protein